MKRLTPEMGSIPMVLMSSPSTAATNALAQFFPPRDATVVSPNRARAKYSAGWHLMATLARGIEKNIRIKVPTAPPMVDATRETPSPIPGLPCRVSGYPSKEVTTADGVPGALMVTAVMEPP